MTLPDAILFPQALLPLYIFEPRYQRMLTDALGSHRMFSVALQKPGRARETPCAVAGLGLIRASVARKDGTSNLVPPGIARVELTRTARDRQSTRLNSSHSQISYASLCLHKIKLLRY